MHDKTERQEEDFEEQEAEVNRTLFIRGLPELTTEDELFELFLQAGPLEKVAIPQNKNIAFITFKHSVSAPYAKELFSDTRLHNRTLNIDFRTGSAHGDNQRQMRHVNYSNSNRDAAQNPANSYNRNSRNNHSHDNSYQSSYGYSDNRSHTQRGPSMQSYASSSIGNYGNVQNPFTANPLSMAPPIQGYRTSADTREYVPQYVAFDNPPSNFRGNVPINHPDHPVGLDERRQRLLNQQSYVSHTDAHRNRNRQGGRRR